MSLLLKQDRDETNKSSNRPISMLNLDFKIFTKILANRLNKFIESIIHTDQTGFIPNRFSFFNVRRVLNIMYNKFDSSSKQAVLCLCLCLSGALGPGLSPRLWALGSLQGLGLSPGPWALSMALGSFRGPGLFPGP